MKNAISNGSKSTYRLAKCAQGPNSADSSEPYEQTTKSAVKGKTQVKDVFLLVALALLNVGHAEKNINP